MRVSNSDKQSLLFETLSTRLLSSIPDARLQISPLPLPSALPQFASRDLRLHLLNSTYEQGGLSTEQIEHIMDQPPYWAFCWPSGRVLAELLWQEPHWAQGKTVLDFGCGSGVVAIAAAMAGARKVFALDQDETARWATELNALVNEVEIETIGNIAECGEALDCIFIADVLYEASNIECLPSFKHLTRQIMLADSRVKDFREPGYRLLTHRESATLPDLDNSGERNDVQIYTCETDAITA